MPAKYAYGALLAYLLGAGLVVVVHPSGNETDVFADGLLWPVSGIGWLWDYVASFYNPMFG